MYGFHLRRALRLRINRQASATVEGSRRLAMSRSFAWGGSLAVSRRSVGGGRVAARGSWDALSLAIAAVLASTSVSTPAFAVTHDDSGAISQPPPASVTGATRPDTTPIGSQPFTNRREPPSYRKLSDAEAARYDLGMAVFNTQFLAAGTPNAGRRAGVGPLFNSSSCDSCHNNGAHGRGPTDDGPAPSPLVIQLATTPTRNQADPEGDPVYGRVLNTIALDGVPPEGVAMIHYEQVSGHYPDGATWSLRAPHYTFTKLQYGPLSPRTLVKPRLAPALFGAGLLDSASAPGGSGGAQVDSAAGSMKRDPHTALAHGRFGWQATALSVRDQTARAFSREMGLTSADMQHDDCTRAETACLQQARSGSPEVSDDIFTAVVSFQHWLAVPASPTPHETPDRDANTFAQLGCVACHKPRLAVTLADADGKEVSAVIAPYTDLQLHDLGMRLADETVAGKKVVSRWRTAPLWGLGYRMSMEHFPTFLHDGRARSAEEAILWHDGEAAGARHQFEALPAAQRKAFLHWLETL
jgi:CxxC motif-containing protein (DUF1111 family)